MQHHSLDARDCGAYDLVTYTGRLPKLEMCTSENTNKKLDNPLVAGISCVWAACKTATSTVYNTCKPACTKEEGLESMRSGYSCGIQRTDWNEMKACSGANDDQPGINCAWKKCDGANCKNECTDQERRDPNKIGKTCAIDPLKLYALLPSCTDDNAQ